MSRERMGRPRPRDLRRRWRRGTRKGPPHVDLLEQALHKISTRNHRFHTWIYWNKRFIIFPQGTIDSAPSAHMSPAAEREPSMEPPSPAPQIYPTCNLPSPAAPRDPSISPSPLPSPPPPSTKKKSKCLGPATPTS